MARLARKGFARPGIVLSGDLAPTELISRLKRQVRTDLTVQLASGGWVHPSRLDGVQPGDEVLIHGDTPAGKPIELKVGGHQVLASEGREGEPALVGSE